MKIRFLLSAFAGLLCFFVQAQIFNTESLRMFTGKQALNIKGGLNFSYNNNDGAYLYQVGAKIGGLLKTKDGKDSLNNKFFLHANYQLQRSENQDFNNNWIVHFRYNKEFNNTFRLEAFAQSQQNTLLSIDARNLIGAGIRLRLTKESNKKLHIYLGTAYMYEKERSKDLGLSLYNHRSSSYFTFTYRLKDDEDELKFLLINTVYFQPLFREFQNYRISNDFSIEFPITEEIGFETYFSYFHNNKTPNGDVEYTSNLGFGFNYSFKSKPPGKKKNLSPDGGKI
ncbi:MAG: DUF481 domain-containing protein [Flavobacteriaceae bacterium]|nr:DUF481 domain-containing protein [Bacteroidia bacterium]NNF73786.1 DUF481 domain-containing protein [Flavobacteriaceae bacterium]NNK71678.1 DUF481 domain-containing protein [Flavobacteriaceae bacterium]